MTRAPPLPLKSAPNVHCAMWIPGKKKRLPFERLAKKIKSLAQDRCLAGKTAISKDRKVNHQKHHNSRLTGSLANHCACHSQNPHVAVVPGILKAMRIMDCPNVVGDFNDFLIFKP